MCLLATVNLDFRFVCLTLKKNSQNTSKSGIFRKGFLCYFTRVLIQHEFRKPPLPSIHGSVSPFFCLLPSPQDILVCISPVFTLLPWCYEVVCVWKITCRSPSRGFSFFCCSFSCFFMIWCRPCQSGGWSNAHVQNDAHKLNVATAMGVAGWEYRVLCYCIPADAISVGAAPTREPWGTCRQ